MIKKKGGHKTVYVHLLVDSREELKAVPVNYLNSAAIWDAVTRIAKLSQVQ